MAKAVEINRKFQWMNLINGQLEKFITKKLHMKNLLKGLNSRMKIRVSELESKSIEIFQCVGLGENQVK